MCMLMAEFKGSPTKARAAWMQQYPHVKVPAAATFLYNYRKLNNIHCLHDQVCPVYTTIYYACLGYVSFTASICQKAKDGSHSWADGFDLRSLCCRMLSATPHQADIQTSVCCGVGDFSWHSGEYPQRTSDEVHQVSSSNYTKDCKCLFTFYHISYCFHRSINIIQKSTRLKGLPFPSGLWTIPMRMVLSSMEHLIFIVVIVNF